jgi:hypothetical protein
MWNLLAGLWDGIIGFLSILLPFGKGAKFWRLGPGARWTLHFVLVFLILIALFVLNAFLTGLQNLVDSTWAKPIWLPLVFLLVYLLLWTGWWIWKLLRAEPEASHFPDIDEAWAAAVRGLAQAGIRPGDLPMFLVLGRPQGPEEHLFAAAQLPLVVKQTPSDPGAPLHVYATRDAIYVTCAGASLLGKHAANVALEGIDEHAGAVPEGDGEGSEADRTIRPSGKEKKVIKKLAQIIGRHMNVVERRAARRDLGLPMPDLLKNPAEMELYKARLAHLGRLLVRDRQPYCAINGLLVLVPVGGTDTEADAQQTAEMCARDLATVRRVLLLQCPILVLSCDLEALPGFRDFIERVSAKERLGRLGQRFPLASPDLAGEALQEQMDKSIHYLCNNYLRDWVYRLFQVDDAGGNDPIAINTGLYLFLDEMRARKKNLSRVLTQGIARDAPVPLLYAGCYLAATGADRGHEQAFVAGVFKRLLENQSFVAWTDTALADDRKSHSQANLGYTLLGGLTLVLLIALGFFFFRKR